MKIGSDFISQLFQPSLFCQKFLALRLESRCLRLNRAERVRQGGEKFECRIRIIDQSV
jgi:hypothetical protein